MPQTDQDRAEQVAQAITQYVNSFSTNPSEFVWAMQSQHRTLQQSFTRLCVAWLKACASDGYPMDGRNKASHEVAKMLLDGHEDEIYLPMV